MNLNSSDYKSRIDVNYILYQPQQNIQKPKNVCGIYMEIDKNGKVDNYELSETQVKMLNRDEDIIIFKPIKLDRTKYKTYVINKNNVNDIDKTYKYIKKIY